jgi:hypothetical protein
LREDFSEQCDHNGREEKGAQPSKHRVRQQRQQDVGAYIAPDDRGQDLVGVLAQFEDPRGIAVAGIGLELQAQLTKAEDRQIETGKQRGLDHAGNNAQPDPHGGEWTTWPFSRASVGSSRD